MNTLCHKMHDSAGHVGSPYIMVTNSDTVALCVFRHTGGPAPLAQTVCSAKSRDCTVTMNTLNVFRKQMCPCCIYTHNPFALSTC
jgi:hypothetical protein